MVEEIVSRVERRGRWSAGEKVKILTEALEPGATLSAEYCNGENYAQRSIMAPSANPNRRGERTSERDLVNDYLRAWHDHYPQSQSTRGGVM